VSLANGISENPESARIQPGGLAVQRLRQRHNDLTRAPDTNFGTFLFDVGAYLQPS